MTDLEQRSLARQASLFGGAGVTALEAARLAAADARSAGSGAPVTLRPYQAEALETFVGRLEAGMRRGIVNLPTGTGKTVYGFALAKRLGGRVCWLAHRDELLRQPLATARRVWPEVGHGLVQASANECGAHVVVASVQTLLRDQRRSQLIEEAAAKPFGLLVVDECHHVASASYRRVLEDLGAFREGGPPTLGLTATLERGDGVGLGTFFEEIEYQLGLREANDRGYLSPFRSESLELPLRPEVRALVEELIGKKPKRPGGAGEGEDLDLKKAERVLLFSGVAEATARAVHDRAHDRKTIVFTCTIEQAKRTTDELVKLGLAAEHVSGEMPIRDRQGVLERFKNGRTRIVCNAAVLTEGFDEPSVDCVVIARPTRSRSLYVQMVGRGLRLYPAKPDCLILDVVFAAELGLQTAATLDSTEATTLFAGGGGGRGDRDPAKSEDEEENRVLAVAAATLGEGATIDGRRERVTGPTWLSVAPKCWAISLYPAGTLVVDGVPLEHTGGVDSGQFEVFLMPQDRRAPSVRVSDPGPFEWVFGVAEDYLRNEASGVLGAQRWRRSPINKRQLDELERRALPVVRTSGEAADLLTIDTVRARLGY